TTELISVFQPLSYSEFALERIQHAPGRVAFRFRRRSSPLRHLANNAAIAITPRMRRQIEQQILPQERRQIDRLRSVQLRAHRERRHSDLMHEFLQTNNTAQLD